MKRALPYILLMILLLSACGKHTADQIESLTWQEQYDLGVRYLSEGNYEEAIITFTVAIEIDPKRAEAYVGRGDAYILSGETEENLIAAQADYEKAIELDKLLAEAYLGLADTYVAMGDSESAMDILRQGVEAVGDDTLFQSRIDELTTEAEQPPKLSSESSPESASGPRMERSDNSDGSYVLFYYDSEGNMTQYYDVAGHMTREEFYNPDGTLDRIHYYDAAGNGAYLEIYTPDGPLYSITYNDAAGNWPRVKFYNPDGTLNSYRLTYYDSARHIKQWEDYGSDGVLSSIHYCDEAGNVTRTEHYNPDGTLNGYSLQYYDSAGSQTRSEYYDPAGNLTGTKTFE